MDAPAQKRLFAPAQQGTYASLSPGLGGCVPRRDPGSGSQDQASSRGAPVRKLVLKLAHQRTVARSEVLNAPLSPSSSSTGRGPQTPDPLGASGTRRGVGSCRPGPHCSLVRLGARGLAPLGAGRKETRGTGQGGSSREEGAGGGLGGRGGEVGGGGMPLPQGSLSAAWEGPGMGQACRREAARGPGKATVTTPRGARAASRRPGHFWASVSVGRSGARQDRGPWGLGAHGGLYPGEGPLRGPLLPSRPLTPESWPWGCPRALKAAGEALEQQPCGPGGGAGVRRGPSPDCTSTSPGHTHPVGARRAKTTE